MQPVAFRPAEGRLAGGATPQLRPPGVAIRATPYRLGSRFHRHRNVGHARGPVKSRNPSAPVKIGTLLFCVPVMSCDMRRSVPRPAASADRSFLCRGRGVGGSGRTSFGSQVACCSMLSNSPVQQKPNRSELRFLSPYPKGSTGGSGVVVRVRAGIIPEPCGPLQRS